VSATEPCVVEGKTSFEVPNTTAAGAFGIAFSQGGEVEYDSCNDTRPDDLGELTITLSPNRGGPDYSETVSCRAKLIDTSDRDDLGNCPE
jgi:hypothetical protein